MIGGLLCQISRLRACQMEYNLKAVAAKSFFLTEVSKLCNQSLREAGVCDREIVEGVD